MAVLDSTRVPSSPMTLLLPDGDFFLSPSFVRGLSGSLHLVLLVLLFASWAIQGIGRGCREDEEGRRNRRFKRSKACCLWQSLACCVGVSAFSFVFWVVCWFSWYRHGWSDEAVVTLFDFGVKALAWAAVCFSLWGRVPESSESKLPLPLRLCLCCGGIVLVLGWFLGRVRVEEDPLEEKLIVNGKGDSSGDGPEPSKRRGQETLTLYSNANFFSVLTFSWISPLIAAGNKIALGVKDVPQLDHRDSVVGASEHFKSKLLQVGCEASGGVTSLRLGKALLLMEWREVLCTGIFTLVETLANYVGPYLIDTFVQYLNGEQTFKNEGYVLVGAFLAGKVVECLAQRHLSFKAQRIGIRTRSVLVAMIYEKGLTLSSKSKQGRTSGEIINFMSVDAERVGDFSWWMHDPWMVVLQIVLALFILYKNLGLAAISAFLGAVVAMLANYPLGSLQEKYQDKLMKSKDERMKATSEILRNMRILKLQGWEMKFLSKINELRKIETGWLKKLAYTRVLVAFVFYGAPTFVSAVTFGSCMLLGIPLSTGQILSALATFRVLQQPISNLPDVISVITQTKVSLDRISSFLSLESLQNDVIERLPWNASDIALEISDGNFSWDPTSSEPSLRGINLTVKSGMKVAVCGTVGSGKSSLLSCILGEMQRISGTIRLCGRKAYVAQSPWIPSGKIEDNILFGKDMNRERYNTVLQACSLKKDLEILPCGDQTVIGERGINLSGGQKQRIQIARAIYQDADVYLFDDPFSAVDAHTGSHLFKECLLGLLSTKTVIYVTHQVEFLPAADLILVMKDGKIIEAGKYDDILRGGSNFIELVGAHKKALAELSSMQASGSKAENGTTELDGKVMENSDGKDGQKGNTEDTNDGAKGQLVQEEEREKGSVGLSVYWKYITTAYGGALIPLILLGHILYQVLQIGSNYWMAWATPASDEAEPPVSGLRLILVYVALSVGSSLCTLFRSTGLATVSYKTATILFEKMHHCIFRAPMSFFDATPSGRILNRASTDQSTIDTDMMYQFAGFASSLIQLIGIIAVMSQVAWQVFIIFIPATAACLWYQQYYISAARELSRLVGICKAPVIQNFAETISGSTTIRSFDQESRFLEINSKLSDVYSQPKFYIGGAMEWLCFRLDMLSAVTFGFSLIFLVALPAGFINPAVAGLAVTYGINLNMIQAWMIWILCNMENKIISVERILQYTSIQSEPPIIVEDNRPPSSWPSRGRIDILNLQVRYAAHLPLVLHGITCTFPGGMKTGIVGRTGSGKSTLIQALFRIAEPAAGQIMIDGIDISSIGLHDLRSRLSIIPQDPTMFEGTVRSNLDPLEEYSDDQIWEALDKCQLGNEVRRKDGKLDSKVTENGENWSMGQRQLVCLGRVLLKKSKILVLDEATASVDTATDNLIQQTVRQHFSECTVITIAHRITSVLDSNMVLLLDNGCVSEYDSPKRLLENRSSGFARLVEEYAMRSEF
ncbi:hypothetical protein MLD38_040782 [Melastoma candidum]|nr:hypothetical protein MLD38_040782 [Melastoma candidum]